MDKTIGVTCKDLVWIRWVREIVELPHIKAYMGISWYSLSNSTKKENTNSLELAWSCNKIVFIYRFQVLIFQVNVMLPLITSLKMSILTSRKGVFESQISSLREASRDVLSK